MHFAAKIAPLLTDALNTFYLAMLRRARLCHFHRMSSVRLAVCPYMTLRYVFHTGWNTLMTVWVYLHSNFSGALRKTVFSSRMRFGRSRSSTVIDFGTNRKRVCDFLLVRHSNLGHILHRFGDIAGFCAHDPTPIPPSFGGCSRCTRSPMLGSVRARTLRNSAVLKLLSKNSNLCDHGIWTLQTERRTDGRTTYCGIAALCVASRCKNWSIYDENMEEHPVFFSDLCLDTFKIGFTSFHFFGFSRCSRNWGQKVTMSPRTTLH